MFDSQRSKICGSVNFRSHLLTNQQQRNGTMYTMCAPRMENSYPSGIWKQSPQMTTSSRNFCSGQKIESPAAVSNLSNTMGNLKSTILPVYNSVKEFFTKFIKSSPEKPISEYNSEPNIYKHSKLDLNDFCEAPAVVTSSVVSLPKEEEKEMKEVSEEVIKKTEVTLSEHKKRKNRKQKRILSQNKKKMNKSGQENNSNKKKKTFNPDNFYQKGKNMNKNKKEKNRHAIECSIHEDFDNNFVIKDVVEEVNTPPIFHATKNSCFLIDSLKQVYTSAIPSVSSCKPQFISFTVEDFPTIQPSRQQQHQQQNQSNYSTDEWNFIRNNQKKTFSRIRQYSECDSEDSFIVFSEESPKVTPSYINRPITLCQKFQKNFSPRQRNISECSDDSFVICFEDDPNRAADENFTYSSGSDSESDSETEGESVGHPPDSGFEDKKVNIFFFNFCLMLF